MSKRQVPFAPRPSSLLPWPPWPFPCCRRPLSFWLAHPGQEGRAHSGNENRSGFLSTSAQLGTGSCTSLHELNVGVSTKRRHAVKSGGVRPAGKERTGQPPWALGPGSRLEGGGAAPRHWQTLTGKRRYSPCPCPLAHAPWSLPPSLEPRPRPPLVFVQNRGDEDWIDNADELSSLQLSFCRPAKPQSQRFGSTALGADGQAAPRTPPTAHTVVTVSDTAVSMHVSFS